MITSGFISNIFSRKFETDLIILRMDGGICSQISFWALGNFYAESGFQVKFDMSWFIKNGLDMDGKFARNFDFCKLFPELKIRKEQAAVLSGFSLIKDNEKLHDVFFFLSDQLVDMVDEFLRKQNNRIWSMIVSNEQTFFEYQTKLLSPVEGDRDKDILQALQIKSKIMDDLNTINDRLDSYYMKLYGEDQELLKVIKADKRLTPEFIANL